MLRVLIKEFLTCEDQCNFDNTSSLWAPVCQRHNLQSFAATYLPLDELTQFMLIQDDHVLAWCFRRAENRNEETAVDVIPFEGPKPMMSWVELPSVNHELWSGDMCFQFFPPVVCCVSNLPELPNSRDAKGFMPLLPIYRCNQTTREIKMETRALPIDKFSYDTESEKWKWMIKDLCYSPWHDSMFFSSVTADSRICISNSETHYYVDGITLDRDILDCFYMIHPHYFFIGLTDCFVIVRRWQNNRLSLWRRFLPRDSMSSTVVRFWTNPKKTNALIAVAQCELHSLFRSLRIFDLCGRLVGHIEGCPPFVDFTFDDHRILLQIERTGNLLDQDKHHPGHHGLLYKFSAKFSEPQRSSNGKRKSTD